MSNPLEIQETILRALHNANNSLTSVYAAYSNQLTEVADSDDYERTNFLNDVCRQLEKLIAYQSMDEAGWFLDDSETYIKWRKRT